MAQVSGEPSKFLGGGFFSSLIVSVIAGLISKYFQSSFTIAIGGAVGLLFFYIFIVFKSIKKNNVINIVYAYKVTISIAKIIAIFWIALCIIEIHTNDKEILNEYWAECIIISAPFFIFSIMSPLIIFYLKQKSKTIEGSVMVSNIKENFTNMFKENETSLSHYLDKKMEEIKMVVDKKNNISCPMATEVEEIKKNRTFAVTGTCIPFKCSNDKKKIETCLICNPNYEPAEWMFPGGHAFKTGDNEQFIDPAEIAVNRTLEEADLRVNIIDINNIGNIEDSDEDSETSDNENVHEQIFIKRVPHFTYLFKLNERVECYKEKGHLYHYDCVYIGEYTKRGKENKKKKLYIQLPVECDSFKCVRDVIQDAMVKHARSIHQTVSPSNIDYVSLMLVSAFLKYKQIKLNETK